MEGPQRPYSPDESSNHSPLFEDGNPYDDGEMDEDRGPYVEYVTKSDSAAKRGMDSQCSIKTRLNQQLQNPPTKGSNFAPGAIVQASN